MARMQKIDLLPLGYDNDDRHQWMTNTHRMRTNLRIRPVFGRTTHSVPTSA